MHSLKRAGEWFRFYVEFNSNFAFAPLPMYDANLRNASFAELEIARQRFWSVHQRHRNDGLLVPNYIELVTVMMMAGGCSECHEFGYAVHRNPSHARRIDEAYHLHKCNLSGALLCKNCRSIGDQG